MIKVIFDWDVYYEKRGGGYRAFCELIKRLNSLPDFEVDFLASKLSAPLIPIRKKPIKTRVTPSFSTFIPFRSFLSRIRKKIDSFYCNTKLYKKSKNALFHTPYYSICPSLKIPQVTTVYDFIIEKFAKNPKNATQKIFINQKKNAILNSIRLVSISEQTKNDLKEFYDIPDDIIDVVHLGVDSDFFSYPVNEFDSKVFLEKNCITSPFILHVGGRLNHKNFENLIKAYAISGIDWLLVAAGYKWTEEEMILIQKLGVKDKVRLILGPNDEQLRILYQKAKIFAYPSYYEGFGLPPLEAMAAGTPVITSNAGSIPEVVGDSALLFNPFNIDDIASKLQEMSKKDIAQKYILKGKERIKLFTWDIMTEKMINTYKKAISQ